MVAALALWSATTSFAQFGWLKKDDKGNYKRLDNSGQAFTLEYPKDWLLVGGAGSTLLTLAEKKGEAAVAVEHTRLNLALSKDEITDLFAELEADGVRERQPQASDVKASLLVVPGFGRADAVAPGLSRAIADGATRVVVVEYRRPGLKGPERVRQYSIPAGADMYRVLCSASATQFQKYQPMFEHIAATFTLKAPSGTR